MIAPINLQQHNKLSRLTQTAARLPTGANPQPQPAVSEDNCNGKLVLPQLNCLHEAFKWSQVSPPASFSSQDQPTRPRPIQSQHSLTQQLTKEWPQYKALRQQYTGTRFEEQHQLQLPQKHKDTVQDSTLHVEMNGLEEQADNALASNLYWKPLSWLGAIRTTYTNYVFDPSTSNGNLLGWVLHTGARRRTGLR